MSDILRKDQLEASLRDERRLIETGALKEDNPLDRSEPFKRLCGAVRRGDLKTCQEAITEGANINARDEFDYTPLILASLCGHYDVVQLLLESGALCERDTFQGERCLYNALTDRIRNLLLEYDYSKTTDPLQPFAAHITSLLTRGEPVTADIVVTSAEKSFSLHKFVLAARSPYFKRKLDQAPDTTQWKLPASYPPQSFEIALRFLYLGELPNDITLGQHTGFAEDQIFDGIAKISRQLEIDSLSEAILSLHNRRLARQHRTDETENGRAQLQKWFEANVLAHAITVDTAKVDQVKWDRNNAIFADVLIRADESLEDAADTPTPNGTQTPTGVTNGNIPIGPFAASSETITEVKETTATSVLFPAHRAILLRSDYFHAMFSSTFMEALDTPHLKILSVSYRPAVVRALLSFLYAERTEFGVDIALDVLFAADELLIDRLKAKTAQLLSTLGSGAVKTNNDDQNTLQVDDSDELDPFAVLDAAYDLRVPRLETFAARFLAYRLERYIDLPEFEAAVAASAARIKSRQETDSIELVDDIRYYLSERFRLRFESTWLEEVMEEESEVHADNETEHLPVLDDEEKINDVQAHKSTQLLPNENGSVMERPTSEEGRNAEVTDSNASKPRLPESGLSNAALAAAVEGELRTLDGEQAGDEFDSDAINYRILLGKIDHLLENLRLDG